MGVKGSCWPPQSFWDGLGALGGCRDSSPPSPTHVPKPPAPTRNLPGGKEQFVSKGRDSGRAASSLKSSKGLQPRRGRAAAAVPMLGCSGAEGRLRRGQELINAKHFWTAARALFAVFISASSNQALRCPLGPRPGVSPRWRGRPRRGAHTAPVLLPAAESGVFPATPCPIPPRHPCWGPGSGSTAPSFPPPRPGCL